MTTDLYLHRVVGRGESQPQPEGYVRPADWLELPIVNAGEQKFVGLYPITEFNNIVKFTIRGDYTVDWGDGSEAENFLSDAEASHEYSYSTLSGYCSRGYKQAIITITPQESNNLVDMFFTSTKWLDINMAGQYIASMSNLGNPFFLLERFNFVGTNSITNFSNFFASATNLKVIEALDTSSGTNFSNMFNLTKIKTTPNLNTSNGTNFEAMFSYCYSLESIGSLDTSQGENLSWMFSNCSSLQTVPLLDVSSTTNFHNMFYECSALRTVSLLNTSSNVADFSSMFMYCYSLLSIPTLDLSNATDASSFCSNSSYLVSCGISGSTVSLGIDYCDLSREALVTVFNNLGTAAVPDTPLYITGNPGVADLTEADLLIATNKGYSIISS